ncbi:MAG: hypothetical protein Q9168_006805 [Polycauliona sp. 1 TL-2023]
MSGPSKRVMTGPPTTPLPTTLGIRRRDIDRFSSHHRIFNTERTIMSASGRYTKWMDDIEAFFNPGMSPFSQSGTETPAAGTPIEVPGMETRPIRRAVSPRAASTKPQSYHDALEAFREERREAARKIDRRAMDIGPFPQIGEDDLDLISFYGSLPESSAAGRKRGAEEAVEEAMPDAPEDDNTANIRAGKRQRSDGGDSSFMGTSLNSSSSANTSTTSSSPTNTTTTTSPSTRRTSSTSTSSSSTHRTTTTPSKKPNRKAHYAKHALINFSLSPTLKETERLEASRRRLSPKLSPKGTRIIKPGHLMDRMDRSKDAMGKVWHTFLAGLTPVKVKVEGKNEAMDKGRKIEGLPIRKKEGGLLKELKGRKIEGLVIRKKEDLLR